DTDAAPQLTGSLRHRPVQAEDLDAAAVRTPQALAALDGRGLAGTVRTEHRGQLTAPGAQAEPVDDVAVAVAFTQLLDEQRGGGGGRGPRGVRAGPRRGSGCLRAR